MSDQEVLFGGNVSAAITHMVQEPEYENILANTLNFGVTCGGEDNDSDKITLERMTGLYIIFVCVGGCALIGAIVKRATLACDSKQTESKAAETNSKADPFASQYDLLKRLNGKLDVLDAQRKEADAAAIRQAW